MSSESGRRVAQAAETRRLILDAALRLFADHGYAATSMAQVAEAAGVALPTVYASVGAKPVLMRELLLRIDDLAGIPELSQAARRATDPVDVVGLAVRLTRQLAERCGDILAAAVSASAAVAEFGEITTAGYARHATGARGIAERLGALGALRADMPLERAAAVIDAFTQPNLFGRLVRVHGWSYDECEAFIAATLVTTLLARPTRRRANGTVAAGTPTE